MLEIVQDYLKLKSDLSLLIKKSGYKTNFIANKIGIQPTTFSVKRQRANWTVNEVIGILKIIENEDTEDFYFGKMLAEMNETDFTPLDKFLEKYDS